MKLRWVELRNFRCYCDAVRIPIDDITTFIGKNDSGKSSIFDALNIFFGNVKFDEKDKCNHGDGNPQITCAFSDYPPSITIDEQAETTLESEYLLGEEKHLVIRKEYEGTKEKVYICAEHPANSGVDNLIDLTNAQLKRAASEHGLQQGEYDQRTNNSIRKALWKSLGDTLRLESKAISVDKGDGKSVYDKLKVHLPKYYLFKADRENLDSEDAAQDPIKIAITAALEKYQIELDRIKANVTEEVKQVATKTIQKMKDFDAQLASSLIPDFRNEPDWKKVFSYTILDENNVPINKRGSGIRRLVLFSFFRAKVEEDDVSRDMVFAIEEPETSQHPDFQKKFVATLTAMAQKPNMQVLLTTHVPGLAEELPTSSLRFVQLTHPISPVIDTMQTNSHILTDIAATLGVFTSYSANEAVKLLFCVEGPNDIAFWTQISSELHKENDTILSLPNHPEIVMLPLGGGTLKQWVDRNYLEMLMIPEYHVYDRDDDGKYQDACQQVNARGNRDFARLTNKREIENYIHPQAIIESYSRDGCTIDLPAAFSDMDDVPQMVAKAVYEADGVNQWDRIIDADKKKEKELKAKRYLNAICTQRITMARLQEVDPQNEIVSILADIETRVASVD